MTDRTKTNARIKRTKKEPNNAHNEGWREAETKYRMFFEHSMVGIFQSTPDGRFLSVNPAMALMWGYESPDELLSSIMDIERQVYVDANRRADLLKLIEEQGEVSNFEFRAYCKDGKVIWNSISVKAIYDEQGVLLYCLGTMEDITRRKRAEEELQHIKDLLVDTQLLSQIGSWELDMQTNQLVWTDQIYLIFEIDPQKFGASYEAFLDAIHPDDREMVDHTYMASIENRSVYSVEHRLLMKDGSIKYVHELGRTFYDENGKPLRSIGTVQDITQRKQTESALSHAENRYRNLVENNPSSLYLDKVVDGNTSTIYVNQQAENLLGYPPREYVENPQRWHELIFPEDYDIAVSSIETTLKEGASIQEYRMITREGGMVWVRDKSVLLKDRAGNPEFIQGYLEDITNQKQAEIELQKRASQLRLINDVGQKIAGILDIHKVLDLSVHLMNVVFGYHNVSIFILDEEQNDLEIRAKAGDFAQIPIENLRIKLGDGIVGSTALNGQMILSNHIDGEPLYQNPYPKAISTASELSLPIKVAGKVVGVLDVQSPYSEAFTSNDIMALETIANQVAIAFENARLYESVQKELAEREQVEEQNRLQAAALESAANSVSITDLAGNIQWVNPAWSLQTGYSLEEAHGKTLSIIRSGMQEKAFYEHMWNTILGGNVWQGEIVNRRKNGSTYLSEIKITPVHNENGDIISFISIEQDITGRKKAESERQVLINDLRERTEELFILLQSGRRLSKTIHTKNIYNIVYEQVKYLLPCDTLIISSYDPENEKITCEYLRADEGELDVSSFPSIPLEPPGQGTQSRVIRSGESLLLPDYEKTLKTSNTNYTIDETGNISDGMPEDADHARSAVIVPVKIEGKVTNVIQVFSYQLNAYTPQHMQFLESLGLYVSAALSNAHFISNLERRVEERTAEVKDLYDNAPVGYHSMDAVGKYIMVNQTELNWLGYEYDEMIGRPMTDFLAKKSAEVFLEFFSTLKDEGNTKDIELEMLCKDGAVLPVLLNSTAIYNQNGFYMSRSTITDITDRKKIENTLRRREMEFSSLVENSPDLVARFDTDLRYIYCNPVFEHVGIRPIDAYIGRTFLEVDIGEMDSMKVLNHAAHQVIKTGWSQQVEHNIRTRFGSRHYQTRIIPEHDENGNVVSLFSVSRDITMHKQAEDELRDARDFAESLIQTANVMFVQMNNQGEVLRVNKEVEQITGYNMVEMEGRTLSHLSPREQFPITWEVMSRLTSNEDFPEIIETPIITKYGDERHVIWKNGEVQAAGKRVGIISFGIDITDRKHAERLLHVANMEMERALRMKDEFLANMSHELRTPLNAILGITESLSEQLAGPLNEKQLHYVNVVNESGQHLLGMINDILDLAKVEAGKIILDVNPVKARNVCESSLRMVKELAHQKKLDVSFNMDEDITFIHADERRLKQVIVNLLSNAVNYTPEGGKIGLDVHGDRENQQIQFAVWDTGPGIHPDELPHLFKPFVQLDSGLTREHNGTGLGLVLVSEMVRLHGGGVYVESEPGSGSRFIVTLPWMEANQSSVPVLEVNTNNEDSVPEEGKMVQQKTILVVEDTDSVINLIKDYLEYSGYHVVVAQNGLEGITTAKDIVPDLILMDVQMPVMDGLTASRKIRSEPELQDIPIIALTALAMPGDRERCLAAGMNEYYSKPIKMRDLRDAIQQLLKSKGK